MRNTWIRTAVMIVALVGGAPTRPAAQQPGAVGASDSRVQGRTHSLPGTGKDVPSALFVPSTVDARDQRQETNP